MVVWDLPAESAQLGASHRTSDLALNVVMVAMDLGYWAATSANLCATSRIPGKEKVMSG